VLAALIFFAGVMTSGAARAEPPGRTTADGELRRSLLAEYLDIQPGRADIERYGPAILGTLFLGFAIGIPVAESGESGANVRWVAAGTSGVVSAVSFSSYLAGDEYRLPIMGATMGGLVFGYGLAFQTHPAVETVAARVTLGSVMATGLALTGMVALDAALKPRVSSIKLERHLYRLRREGRGLTNEDVAEIEADFALTDRPIPGYAYSLAIVAGGLGALAPILSKETSEDDRSLALVFGSSLVQAGTLGLVLGSASNRTYKGYTSALGRVHLAPLAPDGSAGFSAAWTF